MLIYVVFSIIKLGIPLDLYKEIKGTRIIGPGRNVAGFFFFVFIAVLVGIFQKRAIDALYLGIGGWVGTIASSFIKRRIGIKLGSYFFFMDQTDFILGSSLFYISQFKLDLNTFISGIVIALILHHGINMLRQGWEKLVHNYYVRINSKTI